MGAWVAANDPQCRLRFEDTWHPRVRSAVAELARDNPLLRDYVQSFRPASPARHAAISQVLNDFSGMVARHIIERVLAGKLIYSGGDDVLAMLPVHHLFSAIRLLRAAFSGEAVQDPRVDLRGIRLGQGYVQLRDRVMPAMGSAASASIGAVVAHHQAPLVATLRQLREAERSAKGFGRNAFCLHVVKRGGGAVGVKVKFHEPRGLDSLGSGQPADTDSSQATLSPVDFMLRLSDALAGPASAPGQAARNGGRADDAEAGAFSSRAIYKAQAWLSELPDAPQGVDRSTWREMVATYLGYQIDRQARERMQPAGDGLQVHGARQAAMVLAREAVDLVLNGKVRAAVSLPRYSRMSEEAHALEQLLVTTEFLARDLRT